MSFILSLKELKKIYPDLCYSKEFNAITSFCFDSRFLKKGSLFFALKGDRVDGHLFLEDVEKKGACAAVVEKDYRNPNLKLPLIYVEDVLAFLQNLAHQILKQRDQKVIAITGSVGKTTTKFLLFQLLEGALDVYASPKSYNTQITVPISILTAPEKAKFLLLEMGMSMPGQIKKLIKVAPPYCASIIKVGTQHTSSFADGVQGVLHEKAQVLTDPSTEIKVVPFELFESLSLRHQDLTTFSLTDPRSDFYLSTKGDRIEIYENQEEKLSLSLQVPLRAYFENYLLALAIARKLGVSYEHIRQKSLNLSFPQMRFEKVEKNEVVFINDAYNSCPDSVLAAFDGVKKYQGRKIAVISEMNDLGSLTQQGHEEIGEAALEIFDVLYLIGPKCQPIERLWKQKKKHCFFFQSISDLLSTLKQDIKKGDVILVKGARAFGLENLLEKL